MIKAHGAAFDHAAGEEVGAQVARVDQGVQRVSVFAQGVFDVTVIIGIAHGSEEDAVQLDAAGFVVHFEFIVGTLRDFDQDVECFCHECSFECGRRERWPRLVDLGDVFIIGQGMKPAGLPAQRVFQSLSPG